MTFTSYFVISARDRLISAVREDDPEFVELIEETRILSVRYSYGALSDDFLDILVKLSFVLQIADEYGLASGEQTSLAASLAKITGWPDVSVDSFDRCWTINRTDAEIVPIDDRVNNVKSVARAACIHLPRAMSEREHAVLQALGVIAPGDA